MIVGSEVSDMSLFSLISNKNPPYDTVPLVDILEHVSEEDLEVLGRLAVENGSDLNAIITSKLLDHTYVYTMYSGEVGLVINMRRRPGGVI